MPLAVDIYRVFIVFLLLSSATVLSLGVVTFKKKAMIGKTAVYLSVCMTCIAIYDFGYAMELSLLNLETIMFWVRFEHWGIQLIAPLWLAFSLCLSGREEKVTPVRMALFLSIPVCIALSAQTLGGANLFHRNPHLIFDGGHRFFAYDRGALAKLDYLYASVCLIISTSVYAERLFNSCAKIDTYQNLIYLISSMLPWIGGIVYVLGFSPDNIDLIPLFLSVSVVLITFGFMKVGLLDLIPIAREVVFEKMSDAVLVLDQNDRIADFNQRVSILFPGLTAADCPVPLEKCLGSCEPLCRNLHGKLPVSFKLQLETSAGTAHYDVDIQLLNNKFGIAVGKIITLHDVTHVMTINEDLERRVAAALREAEDRDSLMAILARRSEMGELMSFAGHQWQQSLYAIELYTAAIRRTHDAGEIVSAEPLDRLETSVGYLRQTLRSLKDFLSPTAATTSFRIKKAVEDVLGLTGDLLLVRGIKLSLENEGDPFVRGRLNEYSQAVLNIVVNASNALSERSVESPSISIRIGEDGSNAIVAVEDNAGGVDPSIRGKLFSRYASSRADGTGLGLNISKNLIERRFGGTISYREGEKGAIFTVSVPADIPGRSALQGPDDDLVRR